MHLYDFEPPHQKTNNLHICESKDTDQLHEADQRLCFRYMDSTILMSEISVFFCYCTGQWTWFPYNKGSFDIFVLGRNMGVGLSEIS